MVSHDLSTLHDAARILKNPHKGWYHHFPDNHPDKYRIARDADLLEFPGMDHVYVRLAWAYLEPREGQFDWAAIDRITDKWTAHGLRIAFCISCKETSTDRIEQQYATPRWVKEAGARGGHYRAGEAVGPEGPWEPVWGDPAAHDLAPPEKLPRRHRPRILISPHDFKHQGLDRLAICVPSPRRSRRRRDRRAPNPFPGYRFDVTFAHRSCSQ